MKKIKLIAPILGTVGAITALTPLVTLTSCSKDETNKVYLAKGETKDKTVSPTTKYVTYKLKQRNLKNPESLKLTVANLKVNGVKVSNRSKTFSYHKDSAGNVMVRVYVENITASWTNVSTFSFDLLFTNTKAGSKHLVGPFTISFDEGVEAEVELPAEEETEAKFESLNGNPVVGGYAVYKVTSETKFLAATANISITTGNGDELVEGKDFAYDRNGDGKSALLFIAHVPEHMKMTVKEISGDKNPYTYEIHFNDGPDNLPDPYTSTATWWERYLTGGIPDPVWADVEGGCAFGLLDSTDLSKGKAIKNDSLSFYNATKGEELNVEIHKVEDSEYVSLYYYFTIPEGPSTDDKIFVSWEDTYGESVSVKQSFVINIESEGEPEIEEPPEEIEVPEEPEYPDIPEGEEEPEEIGEE